MAQQTTWVHYHIISIYHSILIVITFPLLIDSDHQVNCKCGSLGIADTPWAACLVAENEECPNNFIKLEDDTTCSPSSRRTPAWKPRVCCLLTPNMEFKVNLIKSRCLVTQVGWRTGWTPETRDTLPFKHLSPPSTWSSGTILEYYDFM